MVNDTTSSAATTFRFALPIPNTGNIDNGQLTRDRD